MIIYRYLCKEVFATLTAVTSILLLIFLSRQFVRYLTQAAAGKLSAALLSKLLLMQVPHLLGWLLPLSLFIAILLVYGRMYVDNEMTILLSSGFSAYQLWKVTTVMAVSVAVLVSALVLWLGPAINLVNEHLLQQSKSTSMIELMQPGRFKESTNGKQIYYADKISRDRQHLDALFMAQFDDIDKQVIVTAQRGKVITDAESHDRFLVLSNGYRYVGVPGYADYRVIHFDQYQLRLHETPMGLSTDRETFPTAQVWQAASTDPKMNAELNWRLSFPLSTLLLAWLAIPLSRVPPRQGRYAHLLPAILVYVIYVNLFLLGRSWLANAKILASLGLWWVHGIMLLLILIVAFKERKS